VSVADVKKRNKKDRKRSYFHQKDHSVFKLLLSSVLPVSFLFFSLHSFYVFPERIVPEFIVRSVFLKFRVFVFSFYVVKR